ncbi:MAG: TrkH family potassium uptake protein [Bacteroidota bacterium]
MSRFNFKVILSILGLLLTINGLFMLLALPFTLYYGEDLKPIVLASTITILAGLPVWLLPRKSADRELKRRDGYIVVTLGWVIMSFFGTLPYILSGTIPDLTNAFFETMSGYTTTGASILTDIEALPKGILVWRSLTQWMGGMGIIVLAVAILPMLGIGGMQLFVAEAPGITPDKLKPRIKDTAKRLWIIYVGLTALEAILLMFGGMNFFEAINHSLTTMATGGFSPKNSSIAHYSSAYIQYTITLFMFLAGTSFTLTYFMLKRQFKKVFSNEEFVTYVGFLLLATVLITGFVHFSSDQPFELSFRETLFQVVSIVTTTGFVSEDYTSWTPLITMAFFALMFIGGSAGSTAGGIKIVRHIILFKNSFLEMKRQLHPSAIIPVRFNQTAVDRSITYNVLAFIIIYFLIFSLGSIMMAWVGLDFKSALGSVATSLGNIGPGVGSVGPVDNFSHIPSVGKWILTFLMLLGRLELFTVMILFTPFFWKSN